MKDELVFQQARAIVWAVMQNILYFEWLPILLSPSVRVQYGLDLKEGKFTRYNSEMDPSIFSAFSSAVFRFGHTLIPRSLPVAPGSRVPLREVFFKPYIMRENLDTLVNGLAQASNSEDRTQPPDQFFVEEVTKHLFENQEGERQGFDLVALNLQRGRDHGIPSYSAFREELGLRKVTSFADPQLGSAGADMATVYAHVDDIDLFTGGISEPPFEEGLMGETFSTLAALQFQRLRYGDRFFFDNQGGPYGLSKSQVRSLRKIRLAHVLCKTTGIEYVQRDVFRVPSER